MTAEKLLKKTIFIVEANSFEHLSLWQQHSTQSPNQASFGYGKPLVWEQMNGWWIQIGKIAQRPICINLQFDKLDGCIICFYDSTSQLVDHAMIDKWLDKHFKGEYDNGTRRAQCDAMNFGHCLSAIREHKKKIK